MHDAFEKHFLDKFLAVCKDDIINVRITAATVLAKHINGGSEIIKDKRMQAAIEELRKDRELDVRKVLGGPDVLEVTAKKESVEVVKKEPKEEIVKEEKIDESRDEEEENLLTEEPKEEIKSTEIKKEVKVEI